ncbi:tRNA splicing endonuclease subunit (Sen54), putative [Trichophyton verrucosum HKI 0517]|uniref:tRNA splicing endonuclease subunit (Sen54), putative n=1 Tax=Trichophyton verrucosum (strain HKI 0517) TaxID=663202 RepID=D4D0K0_TRIVH|nr:tRNA splicing endonuclease subunit (Sen54), putative [Trichophyton verrucosum HKI 0517]EFE44618.1 tRNA splicing endonuclease subunit (Sen54), putative [Trichophyton verrucosum HKI 0517]
MADLDEEAINQPLSSSHDASANIDQDVSDETQDFRFLSTFATLSDPTQPQTLPRRGDKDFEPNPTLHQANVLTSARNAMHNALSYPRLHNPKSRIIGVYYPDGLQSGACVCVPNPKGQHFRTIAQADSLNRMWLLPEEALYLLERGSLDIRWPAEETWEKGIPETSSFELEGTVPMSLQAAYACFLGRSGLTMERFSVYSGLRRGGYVVVRADTWDEENCPTDFQTQTESKKPVPTPAPGVMNDIYRSLSIIPAYDPSHPDDEINKNPPSSPYKIAFYVYKPSTPYKKSNPGPPDFRLAVVDARSNPVIPTLENLSALLASTPQDPPRGEKMDRLLYMRLRHGYRNVILAVVDQGVVSYLRISDAGFMKEPLYSQKRNLGPGNKGDSNFCSLPAIIIDIDPNQREEIYDQTDLKGRLIYPFFLDIPLNDVADHRM